MAVIQYYACAWPSKAIDDGVRGSMDVTNSFHAMNVYRAPSDMSVAARPPFNWASHLTVPRVASVAPLVKYWSQQP